MLYNLHDLFLSFTKLRDCQHFLQDRGCYGPGYLICIHSGTVLGAGNAALNKAMNLHWGNLDSNSYITHNNQEGTGKAW